MTKRTFLIKEDVLKDSTISKILNENFTPTTSMVLMVKEFLDKSFKKQLQDDIDNDGYPKKTGMVVMLSSEGNPLRSMSMRELLLMLDDKFNNLVKSDEIRRNMFKQIIVDWFNNKISKEGLLSVNII